MTIQTAIQLSEETYDRLKSVADELGQTPSDFIFAAIQEHLEDMEDVIRAEAILKEVKAGRMKTYALEEVERELGLDD